MKRGSGFAGESRELLHDPLRCISFLFMRSYRKKKGGIGGPWGGSVQLDGLSAVLQHARDAGMVSVPVSDRVPIPNGFFGQEEREGSADAKSGREPKTPVQPVAFTDIASTDEVRVKARHGCAHFYCVIALLFACSGLHMHA